MIIEVTSIYAGTVLKRSRKKSKLYSLQLQEKLKSNSLKLKEIVNDILNIKNIEDGLRKISDCIKNDIKGDKLMIKIQLKIINLKKELIYL